jgi:hypothetical protein
MQETGTVINVRQDIDDLGPEFAPTGVVAFHLREYMP